MVMSKTKTRAVNTSINHFIGPYQDYRGIYSYATFHTMKERLKASMHDLHSSGYGVTDIRKLKEKHIKALVTLWKQKSLSVGTIKNRMSDLRFVCKRAGRASVIKDNSFYGIGSRSTVTKNRAIQSLDLEKVSDPHLKASIRLQQAFGLRREECLKIIPTIADEGKYLRLKGSWTKGNISRIVKISTLEQRQALNYAKLIAGWNRSLIPEERKYIQQRNLYDIAAKALGQTNLHGLRHAFAQRLYKQLTGWECPFNGGKTWKRMTNAERKIDREARDKISLQLGHSRREVTKSYLG